MKVLLRLMKVLLRLMKVLSFKALLRSDSPWIAELPYPLLIQSNGWFEPQPTKGIGIFAVLAMYVQHFPEILAILGIWGPEGSFYFGGVCRIACCFSLLQGLSNAYHLSIFKPL